MPTHACARIASLRAVVAFVLAVLHAQNLNAAVSVRDDVIVLLKPPAAITLKVNGATVNATVSGGAVTIQTDTPSCVPRKNQPCTYVIKTMEIDIAPFTFGGHQVTELAYVLAGPVSAQDSGVGLVVPTNTPVVSVLTRNGLRQTASGFTPAPMTLHLDIARQTFVMSGTFSGNSSGLVVNTGSILINGVSPFVNTPPIANAGADLSVPMCQGGTTAVQLDGSRTTDANNNLAALIWLEGAIPLGDGTRPIVELSAGVHNILLQAVDRFGGMSSDTVRITVGGAPSATQTILGFESLSAWTSNDVPLLLESGRHTQGCAGISVGGSGYRTLTSAAMQTPLAGRTPKLALDVYVPSNQPNPNSLGAVQMYLTCPSANAFNVFIGQAELSGSPPGQFSTVTFPVPTSVGNLLGSSRTDCFFSVAVNMNLAPQPPVLDNLRFE